MARVKFPTAIATIDDLRQDRTYMLEEIAAIEAALGINLSNCGGGGGGSTPRLDQVLNPTADKAFDLNAHNLIFQQSGSGKSQFSYENDITAGLASGLMSIIFTGRRLLTVGVCN